MVDLDVMNAYIVKRLSEEIENQGRYISKLGKNICNYNSQIYSWLHGTTRIPAAALIYLASELNISLDALSKEMKQKKIGEKIE